MKANKKLCIVFYLFHLSMANVFLSEEDIPCSLTGFMSFSGGANRAFSQMAAALLAIDDFNTRNSAVIPELESQMYKKCSVYIPENHFKVHDASERGILPKKLIGKKSNDTFPCAIVGPYAADPTKESSIIAEAWDIPVITHGAESPVLSGNGYPTVFRSCVNTHAMGEVIIQFLRSKGRTNSLGILYLSGDYGIFMMEAIKNAAVESDGGLGFPRLDTHKIQPPFTSDNEGSFSIRRTMLQLKKTTYRTILLTLSNLDWGMLEVIADAAEENQMNGDDYFYVFVLPNEIEIDEIVFQAELSSNLTKLVNGAALLRVLDSFMYKPILGTTDLFLKHWTAQNASLVERINRKTPTNERDKVYFDAPDEYFQIQTPLKGSSFMYDAVMMAGMAKCKETLLPKTKPHKLHRLLQQNGKRIIKKIPFVQAIESLKFTGATGTVEFGEGRRHPRNRKRGSVAYGVYNFRAESAVSNHTMKYYLTDVITNDTVNGIITESSDGPFIFADGTSIPPYLLENPPEENYLSKGVHNFGLVLMSTCLFFNLLGVTLVSCYSKKESIQNAQPYSLYLILLGSTTMVSSIFLRSFDESYDGWDAYKLDKLCMAFPWLLVMGFILTYTSLLSKLFIMKRQKKMSNVDLCVIALCIIAILSTVTVLFVWMLVDQHTWTRSIIDDGTLESYGSCIRVGSNPYVITLVALAVFLLSCMGYMALDVWGLDEQFVEARWIFYTIMLHIQIIILGVPLIFASNEENTGVHYLIQSMLIWIVNISTTTLIFGPKCYKIFFSDVVKMSDSVWTVNISDLHFDDPAEVIGRGTFGLVLLAEYRGTNVAVKRVIPGRVKSKVNSSKLVLPHSPKAQRQQKRLTQLFEDNLLTKGSISDTPAEQSGGLLASISSSYMAGSMASGSLKSGSSKEGDYASMKADFILEMRQLSKLRHPNITTIMGAIVTKKEEPMMIMEYMDHGSLYDVLHNETMVLDGEIILPILCDIAQGLRFLHAADPSVIHGDLKAANVLIDCRFRAKVADFGLSQKRQIDATGKRKVGVTGTPYWMAPELLSHQSSNNTATDVYSFGVILYELYSRKDPYAGEIFTEVLKMVVDPVICKRPPVPTSCPQQVRDMMNECLKHDPKQRPRFADLDVRLRNSDVDKVAPSNIIFSLQEKKKTDLLLYDVFPRHIAEALRDGRKVDPETHNVVTIFFSDIVGFTNISSTLEPIKISLMLDRLYHSFDQISRKHDVFKVETIGDAYMAVTNLVNDQPDHAKRIAAFSIDVLRAASETSIDLDDPERGCVNIRIGFHSGPVVANVVGSRNPRYCLFGDTVNTASRMESNSMENRIHCSERSAQLLREQNPEERLQSRGNITVKGKGEMHTYWVNEGNNHSLV